MVPKDHLLRRIDRAVDFSFIYQLVEDSYCADNGRPSLDPVMLVKIPMIQCLFGIRSMRQTIKEIEVNVAYRWFLGLTLACLNMKKYSKIMAGIVFLVCLKVIISRPIVITIVKEKTNWIKILACLQSERMKLKLHPFLIFS